MKISIVLFLLFSFYSHSSEAHICDKSHRLNAEIALLKFVSNYSQDLQGDRRYKLLVLKFTDWDSHEGNWYLGKGFNPSACQLLVDEHCDVTIDTATCDFD
jgi:hypothetical protein